LLNILAATYQQTKSVCGWAEMDIITEKCSCINYSFPFPRGKQPESEVTYYKSNIHKQLKLHYEGCQEACLVSRQLWDVTVTTHIARAVFMCERHFCHCQKTLFTLTSTTFVWLKHLSGTSIWVRSIWAIFLVKCLESTNMYGPPAEREAWKCILADQRQCTWGGR